MLQVVTTTKDITKKKKGLNQISEEDERSSMEVDNFQSQQTLKLTKGKGISSIVGIQSTIKQLIKKPLKEEVDDRVAESFYAESFYTSVVPFNCIKKSSLYKNV